MLTGSLGRSIITSNPEQAKTATAAAATAMAATDVTKYKLASTM
jgi:hypothetical protein